jgi:recombination protein RecR
MEYSSERLAEVVEALARLPGIGRKTAQRLAFHLLRCPREEALELSAAVARLREETLLCADCGNISDGGLCRLCADPRRDRAILCVVEQPSDVVAIERTAAFRGLYHVLGGSLAPLEGVTAEKLRIADLERRIAGGDVREVIVATNPTTQGEATAHFLADLLRGREVRVTRIARGVPIGSDLELSDQASLTRALEGRADL